MSVAAVKWAFQCRLHDPTAKAVLVAAAEIMDQDGHGWFHVSTLADRTELDEKTVRRKLAMLEGSNVIRRESKKRGSLTYRMPIFEEAISLRHPDAVYTPKAAPKSPKIDAEKRDAESPREDFPSLSNGTLCPPAEDTQSPKRDFPSPKRDRMPVPSYPSMNHPLSTHEPPGAFAPCDFSKNPIPKHVDSPAVRTAFEHFVAMRSKGPSRDRITPEGIRLAVKHLGRDFQNPEEALAGIENAIVRRYKGIFPDRNSGPFRGKAPPSLARVTGGPSSSTPKGMTPEEKAEFDEQVRAAERVYEKNDLPF